jgi:hypothetical protein
MCGIEHCGTDCCAIRSVRFVTFEVSVTARGLGSERDEQRTKSAWWYLVILFAPSMNSPATQDPERRRYPRIKVKVPVELVCEGKAPMRTATDEISLCGCYIETMFTMDIGTRLSVSFSLSDGIVRCLGVVATKYPQVGNGIDFIDIAPDDRLRLNGTLQGER